MRGASSAGFWPGACEPEPPGGGCSLKGAPDGALSVLVLAGKCDSCGPVCVAPRWLFLNSSRECSKVSKAFRAAAMVASSASVKSLIMPLSWACSVTSLLRAIRFQPCAGLCHNLRGSLAFVLAALTHCNQSTVHTFTAAAVSN